MNAEDRFYFDLQVLRDINPAETRKNILIEGTTILWAGEKIQKLENEIEECKQILANGIDRNKDHKDTLRILCNVAVNGIYWRNESIERLHEDNDEMWDLLNNAADKAMEANNNWITLREILKVSRESKE